MNVPEPGRTNHIYSAYTPCVGDPVVVRYDGFSEIWPVTHIERERWPLNGTHGVVIGFRKMPNGVIGTAVTAALETGQVVELSDGSFWLAAERCAA